MRKFAVVTTFHQAGLEQYGQRMIDSFIKEWPKEVVLYVYAEDCNPIANSSNVVVRDLHQSSLPLVNFKNQWRSVAKANGDVSKDPIRGKRKDAGKGFKWDAVRFAHKVYSIFHCAENTDADVLMWMDADMFCHSPLSFAELNNLVPPSKDLCYIGRANKWPECGLYSINLKSTDSKSFLKEFRRVYDDAENGIFLMDEWHDSFVFEEVRKKSNLKCLDWSEGLITGEGHPLINSAWGAYLDHLKGGRKDIGKSKITDLIKPRSEKYWSFK
jgi:hypothetical protein